MLEEYFKWKTSRKDFIENTNNVISELKGKNVLIYGETGGFTKLNKLYKIKNNTNIVCFCPSKKSKNIPFWYGIRNIKLKNIAKEKFDTILITSVMGRNAAYDILDALKKDNIDIKILFNENIVDSNINMEYLLKHNIESSIKRLEKISLNKKVLFYGSGLFFKLVNEYFDLSGINVIGVVDKHFSQVHKIKDVCGYKLYSPDDIIELNPDYIIVTTKRVIPIFEELYSKYLKNSDIKILPLLKKNIFSLLFE